MKTNSAIEAVSSIKSNDRVFIHGGAATPLELITALVSRASELKNVELIHIHTEGAAEYADPKYSGSFKVANLFVGGNFRGKLDGDRVDYLPCFLSEIPTLFRSKRRPLDVAIVQLSPPDQHGFCTLGTSVDIALAAVESAKKVIGLVNHQMPRVHGDGFVHLNQLSAWFEVDRPLPESAKHVLTPEEEKIGEHIAGFIEDGSTLQMGIGSVPDAVLARLKGHKDLGIHTELWSDGALELIKNGVVNNHKKKVHPGKTVSGFITGTKAVYDFIHDNPSVVQLDISYVNSPIVIMRNPKVVAINSAVEVDLTGQVCADSVGPQIISGVGGQMDFMRGAALSEGGKPVLALTSRTKKKISRIVPTLKLGAGVVTTRSHMHYIVTEYGIADLFGKTLGERAKALIEIAHPDDRESLEREWRRIYKKM